MNEIKSFLEQHKLKYEKIAKEKGMTIEEYNIFEKKQYEKACEIESLNESKRVIQYTISELYQDADIHLIDKRIINFMDNKKNFCWLYGKAGVGKTYSLNAISIARIKSNKIHLKIVKEYNIKYDDTYKNIDAIDDFGLSKNENRNKYLLDWYFTLIDSVLENNKKLYITSNLSIQEWIANMKKINDDTVMRIASRLSNVTDIIELIGNDRRK